MPSHHIPQFYKQWAYPGGEVGVRLLEENAKDHPRSIIHRIQKSDDLIALLMLVDASIHTENRIRSVFIPYLPYARQDRIAKWGDPEALQVLAGMLQSVGITDVDTCDVHSYAAFEFFKKNQIRLKSFHQSGFARHFLARFDTPPERICVVVPDKGARGKSQVLFDELSTILSPENVTMVQMNKVRDPDTGKLLKFEVESGPLALATNADLLIADDICDGGGTFLGVIGAVKEKYGNRPSYLFTTHGIYSQGLENLKKEFDIIGSTDSFTHGLSDPQLITIPCV